MPLATLPQQIDDVLEELHMATLIAADRDPLGIFLDGSGDDLLHRAVVPQMNHLGTRGLQNAANDVNRGIVAVKQTGCSNDTDFMGCFVWFRRGYVMSSSNVS